MIRRTMKLNVKELMQKKEASLIELPEKEEAPKVFFKDYEDALVVVQHWVDHYIEKDNSKLLSLLDQASFGEVKRPGPLREDIMRLLDTVALNIQSNTERSLKGPQIQESKTTTVRTIQTASPGLISERPAESSRIIQLFKDKR
jgi:hypothetical protein